LISHYAGFLTGQVLNPNIAYNGQKLIRLVIAKTAANTTNTIPTVPVIISVKYNTVIRIAAKMRTTLSMVPTFFFIIFFFYTSKFNINHNLEHIVEPIIWANIMS